MSYLSEAKALAEIAVREGAEIMNKYPPEVIQSGQLDGEPWAEELRESSARYSAGLKALRRKYPNWRTEITKK